jgi:hypothetical protein
MVDHAAWVPALDQVHHLPLLTIRTETAETTTTGTETTTTGIGTADTPLRPMLHLRHTNTTIDSRRRHRSPADTLRRDTLHLRPMRHHHRIDSHHRQIDMLHRPHFLTVTVMAHLLLAIAILLRQLLTDICLLLTKPLSRLAILLPDLHISLQHPTPRETILGTLIASGRVDMMIEGWTHGEATMTEEWMILELTAESFLHHPTLLRLLYILPTMLAPP